MEPVEARTASKVAAAAEYGAAEDSENYDAEIVGRVEVAPGTWVCAHADGSVSLKFQVGSQAAREWAVAFDAMANEADSQEPADGEAVAAALGKDVTPGHDELHHWWVYGKGRARWNTWTELRDQLVEHVGPIKAAVFASAWFHERYGFWSGSDLNRVKHGKPPRGEKVGPG